MLAHAKTINQDRNNQDPAANPNQAGQNPDADARDQVEKSSHHAVNAKWRFAVFQAVVRK